VELKKSPWAKFWEECMRKMMAVGGENDYRHIGHVKSGRKLVKLAAGADKSCSADQKNRKIGVILTL